MTVQAEIYQDLVEVFFIVEPEVSAEQDSVAAFYKEPQRLVNEQSLIEIFFQEVPPPEVQAFATQSLAEVFYLPRSEGNPNDIYSTQSLVEVFYTSRENDCDVTFIFMG